MRRFLSGLSRWLGGILLASIAGTTATEAHFHASPAPMTAPATVTLATGMTVTVGQPQRTGDREGVAADFLDAIADWLAAGRGLPAGYQPPRVLFVTPRAMAAMRYRDVSSATVSIAEDLPAASNLVAIYDDVDRVIYLPADWTGATPVEQSILVHEMVHHLQNLAGALFSCPQEREQAAYAAQAEWLALFGHDLLADFDTDPMTLLVRTECGF